MWAFLDMKQSPYILWLPFFIQMLRLITEKHNTKISSPIVIPFEWLLSLNWGSRILTKADITNSAHQPLRLLGKRERAAFGTALTVK